MKRNFIIFCLFILAASFFGTKSQAQSPNKEVSKEEIVERIKNMLEDFPEIARSIPRLKIVLDKDGNFVKARFNLGGVLKPLEELDKETLMRIYNRVNSKFINLQAQWIQESLELATRTRDIPKPPPVYVPPKPQTVPTPPNVRIQRPQPLPPQQRLPRR